MTIKKIIKSPWFCHENCGANGHWDDISESYVESLHLKPTILDNGYFHCTVCKIDFWTEHHFMVHQKGSTHRSYAEKNESYIEVEIRPDDEHLLCGCCGGFDE